VIAGIRTFREGDSGDGERLEVSVETNAHGRKLILALAAKKKGSKQNKITMNRLLL